MNIYYRVLWVHDLQAENSAKWDDLHHTCPQCAFFSDSKNFKDRKIAHFTMQEKMKHFGWGLCAYHLDMISDLFDWEEEYYFQIERELGVYKDGYFRTHPDGRRCSIHSPVWKAHLLSLAKKRLEETRRKILKIYRDHNRLWRGREARQNTCQRCAFFGDPHKNHNSPEIAHMTLYEKMGHFGFELCEEHYPDYDKCRNKLLARIADVEEELGLTDHFDFRTLPDGELTSPLNYCWRDHLLSLSEI